MQVKANSQYAWMFLFVYVDILPSCRVTVTRKMKEQIKRDERKLIYNNHFATSNASFYLKAP